MLDHYTAIASCDPSILDLLPEGPIFGTTSGATSMTITVRLEAGDVALVIGPTLLWGTNWSSAGAYSSTEGGRVLRSFTYTILLCGRLELVGA